MAIPDSMRDIKLAFLTKMAADAPLIGLLGGQYIFGTFQPVSELPTETSSYITYTLLSNPELRGGHGDPVFKFQIWGRTIDIVDAVRDRLIALFDKTPYETALLTTPAGRSLFGKRVNENDEFQEHDNLSGKVLHFKFGFLAVP